MADSLLRAGLLGGPQCCQPLPHEPSSFRYATHTLIHRLCTQVIMTTKLVAQYLHPWSQGFVFLAPRCCYRFLRLVGGVLLSALPGMELSAEGATAVRSYTESCFNLHSLTPRFWLIRCSVGCPHVPRLCKRCLVGCSRRSRVGVGMV